MGCTKGSWIQREEWSVLDGAEIRNLNICVEFRSSFRTCFFCCMFKLVDGQNHDEVIL